MTVKFEGELELIFVSQYFLGFEWLMHLFCKYSFKITLYYFDVSFVIVSKTPIRSYTLESIMKSEPNKQVKPSNQTKNKFFAYHENSFAILPDGRTIVGVDKETEQTLITEDISTNKATSFGRHDAFILCLFYHKGTETLFAGDNSGWIKQYKRSSGNYPFTLVKNYGDVGLEALYSSAQVGRFVLFGGRNYSLVAVDIHGRRLCKGNVKSPFDWNLSLQVCYGFSDKVYLSLGGDEPIYPNALSDFLDVTEMYNYKKDFSVVNQKLMQCFKKEVDKVYKKGNKDPL